MYLRKTEVLTMDTVLDTEAAKDFLKSYQASLRKIELIRLQIDELYSSQLGGAIKYNDMPKAHNITDLSDYAAKMDELVSKWQAERVRSLTMMDNIMQVINKLDDIEEQQVLFYRYIKGLQWEDIMIKLSCSWRTMHRYHSKALLGVNSFLKNKNF